MATERLQRLARPGLVAGAVLLALALYLLNTGLGNLNQDEGWYLYAALEQAGGRMPYRDFFFSQGPLMPAVYGLLAPLWAPLGLLGGRLLTVGFGLASGALTALLAAQAVPKPRRWAAAITAWLLTAGNVYHAYFTTIPKTYALAACLLVSGILALSLAPRRHGACWAAAGGFLLALAACTRLSLGAALPVAGLVLLGQHRRLPRAWLGFGLGGAAGLGLLLGPVLLRDAEAFLFANFFHTTRGTEGFLFAAGSVSRLVRNYLPLAALALTLPLLGRRGPRAGQGGGAPGLLFTLGLPVFAAVFIVHLLSPFPYDDYQVPIMPLAAAAVAAAFWRALPADHGAGEGAGTRSTAAVLGVILLGCAVGAGTSTLNEAWVTIGKDRFWVIKKTSPDLVVLRETAREIAAQVPPDVPLLTQDAYLAVEARRRVPRGFEMGPFSYFPSLSDADARRYHVVNANLLTAILERAESPVAAFSGYGFALEAPVMTPVPEADRKRFETILARHYRLERIVPHFGQEHTPLSIWIRP